MPLSLPDILAPKLGLLIVAINPSLHSAQVGFSFTAKGNPFWRLLRESGLIPVLLMPEAERRLLEFGVGVTSSARRATREATELTRAERKFQPVTVEVTQHNAGRERFQTRAQHGAADRRHGIPAT
ncbi:MAG: uracil-DNA glycosylase family protein [Polyangiaceae bacterium]